MVRLCVKRGDDNQFLFDTNVDENVEKLSKEICAIFNGRLKVERICAEIEELAKHGTMYPPEILGLTDEQVEEMKLTDIWGEKCIPSGGFNMNPDPVGRRNGKQPTDRMQEVLNKSVAEAKEKINKKLVQNNVTLTLKEVEEVINVLRGAVTIVYPMKLPPHDPIRMEFSNTEDLAGMQASLEVIEPAKAQLWFAGHQMLPEKKLRDYAGKNEKCKLVVKLARLGESAPSREPVLTEDIRKRMMADQFRRQEELKKLAEDDDDSYLDSTWSDGSSLKRQAHGLDNVRFRIGR